MFLGERRGALQRSRGRSVRDESSGRAMGGTCRPRQFREKWSQRSRNHLFATRSSEVTLQEGSDLTMRAIRMVITVQENATRKGVYM